MSRRPTHGHPEEAVDALPTMGDSCELAQFDRPRGSPTTLAVISDPHLSGTARGTSKMYHRSKQRLQTAFDDAASRDVDLTVVAGDLTRDGERSEYELATGLFRCGPDPTVAVPGNHDVAYDGDRGPVPDGNAFAAWRGRGAFPRVHSTGAVELLALDSTKTDGTTKVGGALDTETRGWLTSLSKPSGPRVAVCHHPVGRIPDPLGRALPSRSYQLANSRVVADELGSAGVDLLLSGHVHWPYATKYRGLNVVGAPSVSSFPPSYLLVDIGPDGTTVSMVPVAGESGLIEAYEFALEDECRGKAIRDAVSSGYFDAFPTRRPEVTPDSVSGVP
ncbi:serine/threonine protein phosphatase [Halovenus sp. WSH3]|uniref:Serine/threonine protein phosphatase n=1 Tax=Halovenus carboxidivorans TaxID=2692199 RepID=A0A6B0TBQ8_9EURY|nr:metallophosphoesterase [Halovenus carboxidivorans]MXR53073.1 serine/threonine protein phosphatase [Halovenus carboxidivorans]